MAKQVVAGKKSGSQRDREAMIKRGVPVTEVKYKKTKMPAKKGR